jgi:hypothetical protein
VTLANVTIHNPPGIYEPITDDEKYIAFGLHTLDNQPLERSRSASISLVSTSFNSGFEQGGIRGAQRTVKGTLPVLVARVGATVESPALNGMKYVFRDFHMQEIGSGVVRDGVLTIPNDQPIFFVELSR